MGKGELLAALGARCAELNISLVSERMLRDWIDEDLIPSPSPRGRSRGQNPDWTYPSEALPRAVRIVELRSEGIKRVTLLRLYLWVEGERFEVEMTQAALVSEFDRFNKRQRRAQPWEYDANTMNKFSERQRTRFLKQLGKPDCVLEDSGFVPPTVFLQSLASVVHWGEHRNHQNEAADYLKSLSQSSTAMSSKVWAIFVDGLPGFLGSCDEIENSGEDILRQGCNGSDLDRSRESFRVAVIGLQLGYVACQFEPFSREPAVKKAYVQALQAMGTSDFMVPMLAHGVVAAYRARTKFDV